MTKFEAFKVELLASVNSRFVVQAQLAVDAPCKGVKSEHARADVTSDNAKALLALYNASALNTLSGIEKALSHDTIAKIFFEAKCAPDFMMRSEKSDNYFNMYAAEKQVRIARTIAQAASLENYTRAVLQTVRDFTANELLATHADLELAMIKGKQGDTAKAKLTSFFERAVSEGTAKTQTSSSVNALQNFEILLETRDAANRVAYKLNAAHKNTVKLLATLSA